MTEFQLSDTFPTWDSRPEWLDEEYWTKASGAEKEEDDLNPTSSDPARKKRRKKISKPKLQKLNLLKDELADIKKDPENAELARVVHKNELVDFVARNLLFLIVRTRKIMRIRIG